MKKMTIKSWALDDRPREKLRAKGKSTLSNAELIAILIGSGNKIESAVDLSKRILQSVEHNLNLLAKLSVEQLMEFNGIGEAKAISILTALELGKRRQHQPSFAITKITTSKDVFVMMKPFFEDKTSEEFWVVYLNNSNRILAKELCSKGGITSTIVDVRLLYKRALELSAVGIVVCHNHPSGSAKPSISDKELTDKIKQAGMSLDIQLLDHLIITEKSYFSFADQGEI
jgi:DNA repair protein RadC